MEAGVAEACCAPSAAALARVVRAARGSREWRSVADVAVRLRGAAVAHLDGGAPRRGLGALLAVHELQKLLSADERRRWALEAPFGPLLARFSVRAATSYDAQCARRAERLRNAWTESGLLLNDTAQAGPRLEIWIDAPMGERRFLVDAVRSSFALAATLRLDASVSPPAWVGAEQRSAALAHTHAAIWARAPTPPGGAEAPPVAVRAQWLVDSIRVGGGALPHEGYVAAAAPTAVTMWWVLDAAGDHVARACDGSGGALRLALNAATGRVALTTAPLHADDARAVLHDAHLKAARALVALIDRGAVRAVLSFVSGAAAGGIRSSRLQVLGARIRIDVEPLVGGIGAAEGNAPATARLLRRLRRGGTADTLDVLLKLREVCACCAGARALLSTQQLECVARFQAAPFAAQYAFVSVAFCRGAMTAREAARARRALVDPLDEGLVKTICLVRSLVTRSCGAASFAAHRFYAARPAAPLEALFPTKARCRAARAADAWAMRLESALAELRAQRRRAKRGGASAAADAVAAATACVYAALAGVATREDTAQEVPRWSWCTATLERCAAVAPAARAAGVDAAGLAAHAKPRMAPRVHVPRADPGRTYCHAIFNAAQTLKAGRNALAQSNVDAVALVMLLLDRGVRGARGGRASAAGRSGDPTRGCARATREAWWKALSSWANSLSMTTELRLAIVRGALEDTRLDLGARDGPGSFAGRLRRLTRSRGGAAAAAAARRRRAADRGGGDDDDDDSLSRTPRKWPRIDARGGGGVERAAAAVDSAPRDGAWGSLCGDGGSENSAAAARAASLDAAPGDACAKALADPSPRGRRDPLVEVLQLAPNEVRARPLGLPRSRAFRAKYALRRGGFGTVEQRVAEHYSGRRGGSSGGAAFEHCVHAENKPMRLLFWLLLHREIFAPVAGVARVPCGFAPLDFETACFCTRRGEFVIYRYNSSCEILLTILYLTRSPSYI